jgi:hypothetical protein
MSTISRQVLSALFALTVIGAPIVLVVWGTFSCKEEEQAVDFAQITPADAGVRGCGDVGPFAWEAGMQKSAASLGDAGLASLFGVWGASEKEIFAVGTGGKAIFYDGTEWKDQPTPTTENLTAVWGTTAKDVWAAGFNGTVIHFDGVDWKEHTPPDSVFYTGDGGAPTGDAAAALRRNFWGIWAAGTVTTDALYVVGDAGTVVYFDGKLKLWSDKIPVTGDGQPVKIHDQLNAVWGSSANKVYIAGNFGTVLIGSKSGLTVQDTKITKDLHGVWGRGDNEVYVVGTGGTVLQYRGGSWKELSGENVSAAPKQVLRGIWGPANNAAITYIVGWDSTLLRMTGGPGFAEGANFDPYYCVIPEIHRLEAIWGTLVPGPMPDAGADFTLGDAGVPMVPAVWAVGASGMVISGP